MRTVFSDDLVAGAIKTDRIAKRNMQIQRQRAAGGVGFFDVLAVLGLAEASCSSSAVGYEV